MPEDGSDKVLAIWDEGVKAVPGLTEFGTPISESEIVDDGGRLNDVKVIIILAELIWNDKKRGDFYGFEILYKLRAEYRLKCPIAICSFMPKQALRGQFPILKFAKNHPFMRLPTSPDEIKAALESGEVADESRLSHILQYCNLRGRLERLITHGKGLPSLDKTPVGVPLNDQNWHNLQEDSTLLARYLKSGVLDPALAEAGFSFLATLKTAIRERDQQALHEARERFKRLQATLQDTYRP